MSQCGTANPMMGGRRRRNGKTKKMRGGNFYGVGAAIVPGAIEYKAVANTGVNPVTGAVVPDMYGGRRRRSKKTKKGGRKSRRTTRRRRTMRGGATYVGSANSGASFSGKGVGGMADYGGYASNNPGSGGTSTQVAGVWSA